ncbi:MAG TPA: hypothetical protein VGS22_24950 [Thermoanaerobaculia bacterium]|jgi:hypothetical protein|nr:hypothetical protein [Thermoanaerobaculia bacterium]
MGYFADDARRKSAALFAATFLAGFCLIGLTSGFLGTAGDLIAAAMTQTSPQAYFLEVLLYPLYLVGVRLGPIPDFLVTTLMAAPYPILGWLIGRRWPLRNVGLGRLLGAVLLRFALVWLPLVAIGLCLALNT